MSILRMRSFTIIFRAVLAGLVFLPFEIYDYLNQFVAGRSSLKIVISFITLVLIIGFVPVSNWNTHRAKTKIKFDIGSPFGTVHGSFGGLTTTIVSNKNDLAGSYQSQTCKAGTPQSTPVGLRYQDLHDKQQWLDTKKNPMISFHSIKFVKTCIGYKAIGNMTRNSTTQSIEMPFLFNAAEHSGLFKGKFNIKHRDFHVGEEGCSVTNIMTTLLEVAAIK